MQTIDPIPNDTHAAAEEPETLHVDPTWESRSLPDGQSWRASDAGHAAAWRAWQQLVTVALKRGEGVSVKLERDGNQMTVEIATVYAPRPETCLIAVYPDGETVWAGEQEAPDLPPFAASRPRRSPGPRGIGA